MTRYAGLLSALLLTGLLLALAPGLVRQQLAQGGRTAQQLETPVSRTLVVWATSWSQGDRALLSGLCSAYEKQCPGLRIYLRRADAAELYAPQAVLPDVLLHGHGDVSAPEGVLLPLMPPTGYPESALWSGSHQGQLLAVPLWYSPNVLCLPGTWLQGTEAEAAQPGETPYFVLSTPAPTGHTALTAAEQLPWQRLTQAGSLWADSAIGFTQLLLLCPSARRSALRQCTPLLQPPPEDAAVVRSLQSHLAAGDGRVAVPLSVVTSLRVRYASVCRHSEDAAGFVRFLCASAGAAGRQQLAHASGQAAGGHALLEQTMALAANGLLLPNAFATTQEAAAAICLEDFSSGTDPVATVLKLR